MKNIIAILFLCSCVFWTTSCDKCDIPVYDGISRVNFYERVISEALASQGMIRKVSFVGNSDNEMDVKFKASVMGYVDENNDREIQLMAVDSLTNVPADHYRINPVILKKGTALTDVVVTIVGTEDLVDKEDFFQLAIALKEGNGFVSGVASRQVFLVCWNGVMLQPSWWKSNPAGTVNNNSYFGVYSKEKHRYILSILDMTPEEFEQAGINNRNYQLFMASVCKDILDRYNAEHRDNPVMDGDQPMCFGDI